MPDFGVRQRGGVEPWRFVSQDSTLLHPIAVQPLEHAEVSVKGQQGEEPRRVCRNEDLTAGCDALLDTPGLWDGMMLRTM